MALYSETAHELHDKLVKKEISSVELTKAVYDRIDEVEDQSRPILPWTRKMPWPRQPKWIR